jgi:hypothetical protein
MWISPVEYLCTHGAADKLIAGEVQSEPIFGYFLAKDEGPGRK